MGTTEVFWMVRVRPARKFLPCSVQLTWPASSDVDGTTETMIGVTGIQAGGASDQSHFLADELKAQVRESSFEGVRIVPGRHVPKKHVSFRRPPHAPVLRDADGKFASGAHTRQTSHKTCK